MNGKLMIAITAAMAATALFAAPKGKRGPQAMAGNEDGPVTSGREAKVLIDQNPKLGQNCCLGAPALQGASMVGQCYTKPRRWIVPELKYTTFAKLMEQLTFTWHVLLDTKSAKENKGNRMGFAPYSYFSTSVTYYNIPQGSHAASVCLPPSYLEFYGEPKAIGYTISNQNGDVLAGDCVSEIKGIEAHKMFWDNPKIMDASGADGKPMIQRRQGLLDRSKTIWALVNPNDYEATLQ